MGSHMSNNYYFSAINSTLVFIFVLEELFQILTKFLFPPWKAIMLVVFNYIPLERFAYILITYSIGSPYDYGKMFNIIIFWWLWSLSPSILSLKNWGWSLCSNAVMWKIELEKKMYMCEWLYAPWHSYSSFSCILPCLC